MKKQLPRRRQRLYFGIFSIALVSIAAFVTLNALDENLQFFATPSELEEKPEYSRTMRLGGYVKEESLSKEGTTYEFIITDFNHEILVTYSGFIPSLFREGQGVVAIGQLGEDGVFTAEKILAKHDEKYMPPEIADKMKEAGHIVEY